MTSLYRHFLGHAAERTDRMAQVLILVFVAAMFWFGLFSPHAHLQLNFWAMMGIDTAILGGGALWLGRSEAAELYRFKPGYILIGVASALLLYGVFWVGQHVAAAVLPFSPTQVQNIYATKAQAAPWLIGALLLLWIGPAEEIFWRGLVQHRLMQRYGHWAGFAISTAVYALIHIWAGNLMLIAAAAIAGAFWGLMFMRFRSVWPGLISHALWDLLIFVVIPLK